MARIVIEKRYGHTQTIAAIQWTIVHNLNIVNPVVDVWEEDSPGHFINNDTHEVSFIDPVTVIVDFGGTVPKTGLALIT